MNNSIDEFAAKLIKQVRDDTIDSCNVLKMPSSRSPMRLKLNDFDQELVDRVLDLLIPDLVDDTIFHFLRSIDGGDIKLIYVSDKGDQCNLESEGMGELSGWLNGEDGWVEKYSKYQVANT